MNRRKTGRRSLNSLWGNKPYLSTISKALFIVGVLLITASCVYMAINYYRADEMIMACGTGMVVGLFVTVISLFIGKVGNKY